MGIDIWAVKLKNNEKYYGEDCWNLINNKNEKEELEECYDFNSREVCSFINYIVLKEMEYEKGCFMGDPILNPIIFNEIVDVFEEWIEIKFNNRYEFKSDKYFEINFESIFESKKFIFKLFNYLKDMKNKNYTMWFSI